MRTLCNLVGDGNLNLDSGVNADGGDLADDVNSGVDVDQALVDAHLEAIPGLRTFTARGLAGGQTQVLGGHADRALNANGLGLGTVDEIGAHLLELLNLARGQGDAHLVHSGISRLLNLLGGRVVLVPSDPPVLFSSVVLRLSEAGFCSLLGHPPEALRAA